MKSPILSNINHTAYENGRTSPNYGRLLHYIEARSEDGRPASIVLDPSTNLCKKWNILVKKKVTDKFGDHFSCLFTITWFRMNSNDHWVNWATKEANLWRIAKMATSLQKKKRTRILSRVIWPFWKKNKERDWYRVFHLKLISHKNLCFKQILNPK